MRDFIIQDFGGKMQSISSAEILNSPEDTLYGGISKHVLSAVEWILNKHEFSKP